MRPEVLHGDFGEAAHTDANVARVADCESRKGAYKWSLGSWELAKDRWGFGMEALGHAGGRRTALPPIGMPERF